MVQFTQTHKSYYVLFQNVFINSFILRSIMINLFVFLFLDAYYVMKFSSAYANFCNNLSFHHSNFSFFVSDALRKKICPILYFMQSHLTHCQMQINYEIKKLHSTEQKNTKYHKRCNNRSRKNVSRNYNTNKVNFLCV